METNSQKKDGWYVKDEEKLGFPEDKEDGKMTFRNENRVPITAIWGAYQNGRMQRACTNDKRSFCCMHRIKQKRPLCPIRDSISVGWYVNEEDFSRTWIRL